MLIALISHLKYVGGSVLSNFAQPKEKALHNVRLFLLVFHFVPSAGIEPTSWVPQTHILSIERRGHLVSCLIFEPTHSTTKSRKSKKLDKTGI